MARFVKAIPTYAPQLKELRRKLAGRVLGLKKTLRKRYQKLMQQKIAYVDNQLEEKLRTLAELEQSLRAEAKSEVVKIAETTAKEAFIQMFKSLPREELKQVLLEKLEEKLTRLLQQTISKDLQDCISLDVENLAASIKVGSNLIIYNMREEINTAVIVKSV